MPRISVVMPAFNKETELKFVLSAICRQSLPIHEYEVIVVDDGSTDGTARVIHEFTSSLNLRSVHLRRNPDGTSQAYKARNIGISVAQSPIIAIIDSDIIPAFDFLEHHLACHNESSNIAVLGFTYAVSISKDVWARKIPHLEMWDFGQCEDLFAKAATQEFIRDKRHECFLAVNDNVMSLPLPWAYFWSHNLSSHKEELLCAGLFDENFRRSGDFDLGYRLVKSGTKLVFSRDAQAFHYPHPRDYAADLKYDRQGEYYFLKKFPNIEVETLVAFGCYKASPAFPEIEQCVHQIRAMSAVLSECERDYADIPMQAAGGSSLVIGCGQGKIFKRVRARGGIEVNPDKIQICRQRFTDKVFYELVGVALPFDDRTFSTIIITDFWRLLPQVLLEKLLSEAARVSRKITLLESRNVRLGEQPAPTVPKFLESENFVISKGTISSRLEFTELSTSE
jgi:glycosyltransferase involved in cell wall biosynthesis